MSGYFYLILRPDLTRVGPLSVKVHVHVVAKFLGHSLDVICHCIAT